MAMSRRFFLKAGALTAVAVGVTLKPNVLAFGQSNNPGHPIPLLAQQQPTFTFTRATFAPYVGGIFQAPNAQGNMVNLTLLSATTNKPSDHTMISTGTERDTESFSLMFRAANPLPQFTSIHQISHPALGSFDLFLTPRPEEGGVMLYEAVFNHI